MKKVDLDELERKARADALRLDGLHGDPAKLGSWIGHRDYARCAVALIARIRELEAVADRAVTIADEALGLGPVVPIDETLSRIERGLSMQRERIRQLEDQARATCKANGLFVDDEPIKLDRIVEKGTVRP